MSRLFLPTTLHQFHPSYPLQSTRRLSNNKEFREFILYKFKAMLVTEAKVKANLLDSEMRKVCLSLRLSWWLSGPLPYIPRVLLVWELLQSTDVVRTPTMSRVVPGDGDVHRRRRSPLVTKRTRESRFRLYLRLRFNLGQPPPKTLDRKGTRDERNVFFHISFSFKCFPVLTTSQRLSLDCAVVSNFYVNNSVYYVFKQKRVNQVCK